MNRVLTACALACAAALTAVAPAHAAKKPAKPKVAKFAASLKGEQVLTWSYNRPQTGMCSGSESGGGSTRITYSDASATLTAFQPPKSSPLTRLTKGRPFMANTLKPKATAVREGRHAVVPAPSPPCPAQGGGTGKGPAPQRCGTRTATYRITFDYKKKNTPSLIADPIGGWQGGAESGELRNTFARDNCPSWITGPYEPAEANGAVLRFGVPLKERTLFDRRRRTIKVSASNIECVDARGGFADCKDPGQFKGRIVNLYTLTLKRR
ncbi:MAG TPA: hypothetical protein VFY44_02405 [Thermoleophilaceae bacterium]|nr:hypothetical protein [Thermoleophilaceae bacterium]